MCNVISSECQQYIYHKNKRNYRSRRMCRTWIFLPDGLGSGFCGISLQILLYVQWNMWSSLSWACTVWVQRACGWSCSSPRSAPTQKRSISWRNALTLLQDSEWGGESLLVIPLYFLYMFINSMHTHLHLRNTSSSPQFITSGISSLLYYTL